MFQRWHRDDDDGHAHLGHGPDVQVVPVAPYLDCDEAGEVDGDCDEAEGKGEDEAVELSASEAEDSEEGEWEREDCVCQWELVAEPQRVTY